MSRFLVGCGVVLWTLTVLDAPRWAVSQEQSDEPIAAPSAAAPESPPPAAAPSAASPVTTAGWSFPVTRATDVAAEQAIAAALDSVADVAFQETPLADVVAHLHASAQVPIMLDRRALDDAGMGGDTPVTFALRGVSLRSLLRLMLHELDLTWMVRDQALVITTREVAEFNLAMRVYAVADLVPVARPRLIARVPSDHYDALTYDALTNVIESVVEPESWDCVGGAGSVELFERWGTLAVSQTAENHEALEMLLAAVRKARHSAAGAPGPDDGFAAVPVLSEQQLVAYRTIQQALEAPAECSFEQQPLQEIAQWVGETYRIPVVIDRRALDDAGMGSDTPVTISLQGVSLRAALHHMLRELNLTSVISCEVLKITTLEEAEKNLQTWVYPVADLIAAAGSAPDGADRHADDYYALISTIVATIQPHSWDEVGGWGMIEPLSPWQLLVIAQTQRAHEEITGLLQAMRQARAASADTLPAAAADMSAAPPLQLRLYETSGLAVDQLQLIIQGAVAPETWGAGPDQGAIFLWGDCLLIRQSPTVHADVQELIRELQILGCGR